MIKRDSLQRMAMHTEPNGKGGKDITYDGLEFVDAYVSVDSMTSSIGPTEFGLSDATTITAVTNYYLDTYKNVRYKWNGKLFQLVNQQKIGNEWRSILKEVEN